MSLSFMLLFFGLLLQQGCMAATGKAWSPHIAEDVRASIRTIEVVVTEELSRMTLELPSKGAMSGAGRKSGKWAGNWAMSALAVAGKGREPGLTTGAAMLVVTPVVASAGAVYGAVEASPAEAVESKEAQVRGVLQAEDLIHRLRQYVCRQVADRTDIAVASWSTTTSDQDGGQVTGPAGGGARPDTILRIQLMSIDLRGAFDVDPPLALHLEAQATLTASSAATQLYSHTFRYVTGARRLTLWTMNDAKSFQAAVDISLDRLAELMVEDLFLIHPFLHDHPGDGNES